jgi:serine/threonine protein kinase
MTRESLREEPRGPVLTPGSQLGPYQIFGLLGVGGMGHVYKAFDGRLRREVAIKVADEQFSGRFAREVRAVAELATCAWWSTVATWPASALSWR